MKAIQYILLTYYNIHATFHRNRSNSFWVIRRHLNFTTAILKKRFVFQAIVYPNGLVVHQYTIRIIHQITEIDFFSKDCPIQYLSNLCFNALTRIVTISTTTLLAKLSFFLFYTGCILKFWGIFMETSLKYLTLSVDVAI